MVSDVADWLRRNWGWSNSRAAWLERLGVLLWLLGVIVFLRFADRFTRPQQVILGAAWLGLLIVLFREGWNKMFGPVLFYDLIRQTRRKRYFWLRFLYALAMAIIFGWIYALWYENMYRSYGENIPIRDMAEFAEGFFFTFMIIQFILIALMTPGYVASAIAEEKERKTLEFLLATDLRNREIVFGKLAARVGTLVLFLITGLPILSMIQFFGGIDPDLLLAGFAAALISLFSLSAVSLAASVLCRKSRDAIAMTYFIMIAYIVLSLMGFLLQEFTWSQSDSIRLFGYELTIMDAVEWFASGNIIYALGKVVDGTVIGFGTTNIIAETLKEYAIFHGMLIIACLLWGVTQLRSLALRQSYGMASGGKQREREAKSRPVVGENAMIWKEVFIESGARLPLIGKLIMYIVMLVSFSTLLIPMWDVLGGLTVYLGMIIIFVPVLLLSHDLLRSWKLAFLIAGITSGVIFVYSMSTASYYQESQLWVIGQWQRLNEDVNTWVRTVGTIVSSLILLSIGIRAAGSISGERDRQTFDSLMTTPLSTGDILWGKWWGCILGMRKMWMWLGVVWLIGLMFGGLHLAALPGLILGNFIFAAAFAWLGLWFSVTAQTTLKATMATIMTSLFLGGGYFIVFGLCCALPYGLLDLGPGRDIEIFFEFLLGFCPPSSLAILPFFSLQPPEYYSYDEKTNYIAFVLIGLIGWTFFAAFLAHVTQRRFRVQYNRVVQYPGRAEQPRRSVYDTFDDDDRPDGGLSFNRTNPRPR